MTDGTASRYPGYNVLSKRDGPSWDEVTRQVIDRRLNVPREPRFLDPERFRTLKAVCGRILPQPPERPDVPLAAHVDAKLFDNALDGYRHADLPPLREAWLRGLAALDAEAHAAHGRAFADLAYRQQDTLLRRCEAGELSHPAWDGMPPASFFSQRVLADIVAAYYAHPSAWSEIGYGGPASPRGYVRMGANRRDPWEASEARPGRERTALKENRRVR
ncbi:gluconate 2-dehydrogenase subunit 3 family protein [Acetobacteraceae bacterium KSS8]|uniref:Gluconate 2-dehydrogenase subunit 3 family protein n=1 Tax=Endosaccharibacter trunci TaxID=2812733 RepID=A0ABT1WAS8_9PROT|nr:gluconate 2-dehydrogenase subunit 3 family protein [Acetobacteraceae bacterium KSS8]